MPPPAGSRQEQQQQQQQQQQCAAVRTHVLLAGAVQPRVDLPVLGLVLLLLLHPFTALVRQLEGTRGGRVRGGAQSARRCSIAANSTRHCATVSCGMPSPPPPAPCAWTCAGSRAAPRGHPWRPAWRTAGRCRRGRPAAGCQWFRGWFRVERQAQRWPIGRAPSQHKRTLASGRSLFTLVALSTLNAASSLRQALDTRRPATRGMQARGGMGGGSCAVLQLAAQPASRAPAHGQRTLGVARLLLQPARQAIFEAALARVHAAAVARQVLLACPLARQVAIARPQRRRRGLRHHVRLQRDVWEVAGGPRSSGGTAHRKVDVARREGPLQACRRRPEAPSAPGGWRLRAAWWCLCRSSAHWQRA